MITGRGPSNRHEIFYFGESSLGAIRIDDFKYRFIDQPAAGWVRRPRGCSPPDQPSSRSFRARGPAESATRKEGSPELRQLGSSVSSRRFVFVQQQVEKLAIIGYRVSADAERREL